MKIVTIHEAKTKLSALLAEVEKKSENVLICRHGKPIADLVPHRKSSQSGCTKRSPTLNCDVSASIPRPVTVVSDAPTLGLPRSRNPSVSWLVHGMESVHARSTVAHSRRSGLRTQEHFLDFYSPNHMYKFCRKAVEKQRRT